MREGDGRGGHGLQGVQIEHLDMIISSLAVCARPGYPTEMLIPDDSELRWTSSSREGINADKNLQKYGLHGSRPCAKLDGAGGAGVFNKSVGGVAGVVVGERIWKRWAWLRGSDQCEMV